MTLPRLACPIDKLYLPRSAHAKRSGPIVLLLGMNHERDALWRVKVKVYALIADQRNDASRYRFMAI